MKPTHLDIIGRSKYVFAREISNSIPEKYHGLIKYFKGPTTIVFAESVQNEQDVHSFIDYLERRGLAITDLRLRYPALRGNSLLKRKLQNGISESALSFGGDVAERDDGLARYFVSTRAYTVISERKKHVVIGPKGSGKSAILKEVADTNKATMTITPEHYATEVLNALNSSSENDDTAAYITTWKYTLLVEIFKQMVSARIGEVKPLGELRNYLLTHGHLGNELSMFERFLGYIRRIAQIKGKVGPVEGEIGLSEADELGKLFKMDELLGLLPVLNKALKRTKFTVFIDELDQSWNNSNTANKFLVSLLTAAIQLRGVSNNLHIVVFLRTEIFNLLKPRLPQLDKLRSDIESIQWTIRELKNMIVSRALDSLKIDEDISADIAIQTIFPPSSRLFYETAFEYVVSRTSYRPREVIQFCNLALEEALLLEVSNITSEAILRAEEVFSTWKADHIVAENMYIYPGLHDILEYFRGKTKRLEYSAFDGILTDIILDSEKIKELPDWLRGGLEPQELMQILYDIEVIGIEKSDVSSVEHTNMETSYDFSFRRPKGKPEMSQSFLIHPGLWKTLEIN